MTTLGIIEPNYYLRTTCSEFLGSFSMIRIQLSVPGITEFAEKVKTRQFNPPGVLLAGVVHSNPEDILTELRYLKTALPATKVILISSCTSPQMIATFLRLGADGHLMRSPRPKELMDAIEAVQNEGGYLCGQSVVLLRRYLASPKQSLENILTPREREIIAHIKCGTSVKQIASILQVSQPTVNFHLQNVYKKFKVSSRSALMANLAS